MTDNKPRRTYYLVTGDIGGTNSRLGFYDVSSNIPLKVKFYANDEYLPEKRPEIFEKNVLTPFLEQCWEEIHGLPHLELVDIIACLAIAGPVADNQVQMSNLHDIIVDGNAIERNTSNKYLERIQVCNVINDFVAQGYGCLTLEPREVRELTPGSHKLINCTGPKVCVGAGTGLGECYLTAGNDGSYKAFPSEGGHVEFSPRTPEQIELLQYLMKKFESKSRISVERVVSGRGLANVYEFLAQKYPGRVDQKVHAEFLEAGDLQGKVVAENATEGSLCLDAIETMMTAYGCEVGSAAIKFIPTGGMFVTGGLTPKNIHFIEGQDTCFMKAYRDKGRVAPLLDKIPLFAVMVEDLGVRGAHKCAVLEYEKYSGKGPSSKSKDNYGPLLLVGAAITAMAAGVLLGNRRK